MVLEDVKSRIAKEQNVYADVYAVLLAGMIASTVLFAIGVVRALLHSEVIPLTPEWVKSHYAWTAIKNGLRHFDPTVLMLIATALLILTPIARVIVSIYAFAVDRDWKFVAITSIVLAVMALTIVLGELGLR